MRQGKRMRAVRLACLMSLALLAGLAAEGSRFPWSGRSVAASELRDIGRRIAEADGCIEAGDLIEARTLYAEARRRLQNFEREHPGVDASRVKTHLQHCEMQLVGLASADSVANPDSERSVAAERINDAPHMPITTVPTAHDAPEAVVETASVPVLTDADWRIISERLNRMRAMGRTDDALSLLRVAVTEYPDERVLRLWLAAVLLEEAEYEDALMAVEHLDGQDEAALLLQAAALYGVGAPFDALLRLDRVLELRPRSAQAYLNLAHLRHQMDPEANAREAEAYYRYAVRLGAGRDAAFERRIGMSER